MSARRAKISCVASMAIVILLSLVALTLFGISIAISEVITIVMIDAATTSIDPMEVALAAALIIITVFDATLFGYAAKWVAVATGSRGNRTKTTGPHTRGSGRCSFLLN